MTESTLDTPVLTQGRETPRSLIVAFALTVVLLVAAPFVVLTSINRFCPEWSNERMS